MECAKLMLGTNESTSHNTNNTNFNFDNINLRMVLGDMYDRYERFVLRLDSISFGINATGDYGTTQEDETVIICLSGLPFINSTYNFSSRNNINYIQLTPLKFSSNPAISGVQYFTDCYTVFGKAQDMANINIFYQRQKEKNPPNTGNAYPECCFFFTIFGIPNKEIENLKPPTRMDNNTGRIK